MSRAYYNEYDPFAAAWLRELMADGLIAPGDVDERSIVDVRPADLDGYDQCHFFAGIGVWSRALRNAGWPDDRPIWTASCPCQPFSAAGKGGGFADERHLWPDLFWLIRQCRPELVVGEQVSSDDGLAWLDVVQADLDQADYTSGALDTCAAGFGAPHIRQRLYWMAHADDARLEGWSGVRERAEKRAAGARGVDGGLADTNERAGRQGRQDGGGRDAGSDAQPRSGPRRDGERGRMANADGGNAGAEREQRGGEQRQQPRDGGAVERMADADTAGPSVERGELSQDGDAQSGAHAHGREPIERVADAAIARRDETRQHERGRTQFPARSVKHGGVGRPGPTNGLWRDADWLGCRDGKWRPVAPGTFPLAPTGTVVNRVGTLRGAGNALNVAQAQGFIEAVIGVAAP